MAKSYLDKDGLLYFLQKIRPSSTPLMDGTASTGTSKRFAAEDHVHPSDTTKAPLASPALTGTPTAPTAATGTTTTQIATTEFVANTVGAMTSGVSDVKIGNTSIVASGIATIPESSSTGAGVMTSTQYSKLAGIASGAEVNVQSDWNQTNTSADDYIKNKPTIPAQVTVIRECHNTNLTFSDVEDYIEAGTNLIVTHEDRYYDYFGKSVLNGVTTYNFTNTSGYVTYNASISSNLAMWIYVPYTSISSTERGAASGVCPLNSSSKVDASYLPSYVDDVIEAYARSGETALSSTWLSETSGGSALTPETGKIYILMADTTDYAANTQFRWGGSTYVKMNDGGVSAITNAEIDTIVAS